MALSKIFVAPKNGQGEVKKSKKKKNSEKIFERWKKIWGPLEQGSPNGIPPRPSSRDFSSRPVPSRPAQILSVPSRPVPANFRSSRPVPRPAFVPFKNLYLISEIIL